MPQTPPQHRGKRALEKHRRETGEHSSKKARVESIPATEDGYSDTDHSDTDDEFAYQVGRRCDEKYAADADARNSRMLDRLAAKAYRKKLKLIAEGADPNETMFGKKYASGTNKLLRKNNLFRKEAAFKIPSVGNVSERSRLAQPTEAEQKDLSELNARLANGGSLDSAMEGLPNGSKFLVAQYRGLFYAPSKFDAERRRAHRAIDERGRPIFSQAALEQGPRKLEGYYALYNNARSATSEELYTYQNELVTYGEGIRAALHALKDKTEVPDAMLRAAPRSKYGNLKPRNLHDLSSHYYSQDYAGFHASAQGALERRNAGQPAESLDPLFEGLPNAANPKVSTGDIPVHAHKYAWGLKPYSGHEHDVLEPLYDERGRPKHPYSGKSYTSLHKLEDYNARKGATQLLQLQADKRINIGQVILPESETQFDGYLEGDRVVAQRKAKFPNFDTEYKAVYACKYGIDKSLFRSFKSALHATAPGSNERVYVESLLSHYLSTHADFVAVEDAQRLAESQGARLVYRSGASFTFNPPKIHQGQISWPDPTPTLRRRKAAS
jgi:hypothetical protein